MRSGVIDGALLFVRATAAALAAWLVVSAGAVGHAGEGGPITS